MPPVWSAGPVFVREHHTVQAVIDWLRFHRFDMKRLKLKKRRTATDIAGIIQRFLDGNSLYAQEWNDFVECEQDEKLDLFRKRCYQLDPPSSTAPDPQDATQAMAELRDKWPRNFGK